MPWKKDSFDATVPPLCQPDQPKETGSASLQTWHFAGSNTAAMGSGGAGSCSRGAAELRAVPSPKSDTEAAKENSSSRDGVSPFLINWGRHEIIAAMLGASLSSGKRWVAMKNLQEPTRGRVWEELASRKGKE